jgi:2,5-diketo-D-gluconate reductase A
MASDTDTPMLQLNDGEAIPQLGVGVFQVPPEDTFENVATALRLGYRHIDTARMYGNEAEVGQAIKASGIPREELFVTTKLSNDDHGHDRARRALKESLDLLELDHLDLYLIHWPLPMKDDYVETWQAFVDAQKDGDVRSIGVSNFQPDHLARIVDATGVTPAVNQIELHPYLQQHGLRREHGDRGIVTEAWSPIAQGAILDDDALVRIGEAHGKSAAQVALRWHIQLGSVIFPKSASEERLKENFEIFDFTLSEAELGEIEGLDRGERTGPDPDTFGG